jgi:hypothetical protein
MNYQRMAASFPHPSTLRFPAATGAWPGPSLGFLPCAAVFWHMGEYQRPIGTFMDFLAGRLPCHGISRALATVHMACAARGIAQSDKITSS